VSFTCAKNTQFNSLPAKAIKELERGDTNGAVIK
jgi:hypothetical protein